tara:strand:- start:24235 stop:25029 length:795 start_codon:yes stop_codon:yes gene_type:complete
MNKPSLHSMASQVGEDAPLLSTKVMFSGLSFALFGLVGALLSITVFPMLHLLPLGRHLRQRWARKILSTLFPLYIRFMERCGLIRLHLHDCDSLAPGGQLLVANHPSLLDVVYLIALVDNANCLVKRSLFFNPFTAAAVRAAGYIRNDSDQLLELGSASLAAGDSLIIFPEGTRTDPQKPFRFLRGSANIALAAGCDIHPLVIRCRPARLMKHQAWYEMSSETLDVHIEAHSPIPIAPYLQQSLPRSLSARRLTADLEAFYRCR